MRCLGHMLLGLCFALMSTGCDPSAAYQAELRSLDSLAGAVGSLTRELQRIDTVKLQKAVTRFNYYRAFIRQNVNDTLSKTEADALQRFYTAGNTLQQVSINNKLVLSRATLMSNQISRLSSDIAAARGRQIEQHRSYRMKEEQEVSKLMDVGQAHQQRFFTALETFKNALPEVEQLIRRHNRGHLPVIVKDTLNL